MTLDWSAASLIERGEVDPSWHDALERAHSSLERLRVRLDGHDFLPAAQDVFRALTLPMEKVRALILGQDPYPTPGLATGLAFSVSPDVRPLPASLRNIFREREADIGIRLPRTGDLSPWVQRGVLLLNRHLTVSPGKPLSHQHLGWETVTNSILTSLAQLHTPFVAILWGAHARSLGGRFADVAHVRVIESAHPSPLSASRGFFGSRPFSRTNKELESLGLTQIDWTLDES